MTGKTNVMPGDKAIVVRCSDAENISVLVLVERPFTPGEKFEGVIWGEGINQPIWVVSSLGRPLAARVTFRRTGKQEIRHFQTRPLADGCLRRLPRPNEMPEDDSLPVERPTKETA